LNRSWLRRELSRTATAEKPPVNLKLILEGEEESGSENILAFVAAHGDRLKAEVCVLCDGGVIQLE
jgi:acetylornithine deacetylase/succinyl-diaminopimelate desuccinylase-like protein